MLVVGAGQNQYAVNNSLRFRSSASATLSRTWSASGTTGTFSFWVKRGSNLGAATSFIFGYYNGSGISAGIRFVSDQLEFYTYNAAYTAQLQSTQVFRDPSAWYHIVCVWDTTNATSTNRMRMYVNGSQVTAFAASVYPAQNTSITFSTSATWAWGNAGTTTSGTYNDMYLAEVNVIDGLALTPSSFGANAGPGNTWQPIRYAGTYGTNGFYLNFSNIALTSGSNAGLGKDFSGNANYWTTNNISVTSGTTYDAMTDSPTLTSATVANYAVLNPLDKGTTVTVQNANLQATIAATHNGVRGTFQIPTSGKWYWEVTIGTTTSNSVIASFGLATNVSNLNTYAYNTTGTYALYCQGSPALNYVTNGSVGTTFGSAVTGGTVCNIAYDADNGQLYLGVGNTYYSSAGAGTGNPSTATNPSMAVASSLGLFPYVHVYSETVDINFGQRPFSYTPPSGFVALNTYNLPTPSLPQGNKYMDATVYTSNGTTQTITNTAGFKPDLVWTKDRASTAGNALNDSVRGAANYLLSYSTTTETNSPNFLTSFNSNGFSMGTSQYVNGNSVVGWQWQAGQGTTSTNTSGTIPSTVSVNPSAGFSIVTYVGSGINDTVGHGLGVAPKMVIVKSRNPSAAYSWFIYHTSLTSAAYTLSFDTAAQVSTPTVWNSTAPTSTVFSIGTAPAVNESGKNLVAYCWAAIPGFSAFGSYTGNGSADGPFVYLGFRPRYIMFKNTSSTGNWMILDTARDAYNVAGNRLYADSSSAESAFSCVDIVSNGFKIRATGGDFNSTTSGWTYIYAAFAENPFKYSSAR